MMGWHDVVVDGLLRVRGCFWLLLVVLLVDYMVILEAIITKIRVWVIIFVLVLLYR